jgi:hypothetical protein
MAMTAEEMVVLYRDQFNLWSQGFVSAIERGDCAHASQCVYQQFHSCQMEGLICWRRNFGSPVEVFAQGVDALVRGHDQLSTIASDKRVLLNIPVEQATIIAYLLGKTSPRLLMSFEDRDFPENPLDALLAKLLYDGSWSEKERLSWSKAIARLERSRRTKLAFETYSLYERLLFSESSNVSELISTAETLYLKKAKDSYFSNGESSFGGGPDNEYVVDFRLSAIMKKVNYSGDSIHRWQWD